MELGHFPEQPATGFSVTLFFFGVGSILGPALLGLLGGAFGIGSAFPGFRCFSPSGNPDQTEQNLPAVSRTLTGRNWPMSLLSKFVVSSQASRPISFR